ncbi:MAG: phosphoribosylformylglycinamidine synthase subunit PurQ [Deltaproteobacteria bacterium]|nr:phosphoribosylformylglycinamidine synthase subunit PurQ [Deltaproteobacteria bacterium]
MKAVVVQFPGSNADWDAMRALRDVAMIATEFVFHKASSLPSGTDLVVLPGGFSFGDYLRCGAIARFSPIIAAVRQHAERGGFVLGICNGFQILTEANMLPGALTRNTHLRFECRDIHVRVDAEGPFTAGLAASVLRLPIAHAEGRYHADEETLAMLERERRVAFRYVRDNPNGSLNDIAGIYGGPRRNVLGLMPHPERACEPALGSADGRQLLSSITKSILAR